MRSTARTTRCCGRRWRHWPAPSAKATATGRPGRGRCGNRPEASPPNGWPANESPHFPRCKPTKTRGGAHARKPMRPGSASTRWCASATSTSSISPPRASINAISPTYGSAKTPRALSAEPTSGKSCAKRARPSVEANSTATSCCTTSKRTTTADLCQKFATASGRTRTSPCCSLGPASSGTPSSTPSAAETSSSSARAARSMSYTQAATSTSPRSTSESNGPRTTTTASPHQNARAIRPARDAPSPWMPASAQRPGQSQDPGLHRTRRPRPRVRGQAGQLQGAGIGRSVTESRPGRAATTCGIAFTSTAIVVVCGLNPGRTTACRSGSPMTL